MHFSDGLLFVAIASLLSTFTFSKKKDENGMDIEPLLEDTPNSLVL